MSPRKEERIISRKKEKREKYKEEEQRETRGGDRNSTFSGKKPMHLMTKTVQWNCKALRVRHEKV